MYSRLGCAEIPQQGKKLIKSRKSAWPSISKCIQATVHYIDSAEQQDFTTTRNTDIYPYSGRVKIEVNVLHKFIVMANCVLIFQKMCIDQLAQDLKSISLQRQKTTFAYKKPTGFLLLAVQLYPLNMYLPYRRYVQKYRERKWKGLPEKCCKVEKTGKEASSVHIILNFKLIHTSLQPFSVTSRSVSTGMKNLQEAYAILAILRNKRRHPTYHRIMEASHAVNLSQLNQKHNLDRPHT